MSSNPGMANEEHVKQKHVPSDEAQLADKSNEKSPTRKRKQEEVESEGLSNGKEQATTYSSPKKFILAKEKGALGISMKLGSMSNKKQKTESPLQKKTGSAASAFDDSDDDDEEEMPREAKMRMRNLGKETPTSAGPNSFNKGRKGFTHHQKVWEKSMKLPVPSENDEKE